MADHMRTDLVIDALNMAAGVRGGHTTGIIFHSDRGAQYLAKAYSTKLKTLDMVQSVGRTGTCWDNSVAESFFSSLKRELIHRYRFEDRAEQGERSSPGSIVTTPDDCTPASDTVHPSTGRTPTNNRPKPRKPRDRPTGGRLRGPSNSELAAHLLGSEP